MAFDFSKGRTVSETRSGFDFHGDLLGSGDGALRTSDQTAAAQRLAERQTKKRSVFGRIADFMLSSEMAAGETIGAVASRITGTAARIDKSAIEEADARWRLARQMNEPGTTEEQRQKIRNQLESTGQSVGVATQQISALNKTAKQVYGEALGVTMDMVLYAQLFGGGLTVGKSGVESFKPVLMGATEKKVASKLGIESVAKLSKATKSGFSTILKDKTLTKMGKFVDVVKKFTVDIARAGGKGATEGMLVGAARAMRKDASDEEILNEGLDNARRSAVWSMTIAGASDLLQLHSAFRSEKLRQKAIDQYIKTFKATGKNQFGSQFQLINKHSGGDGKHCYITYSTLFMIPSAALTSSSTLRSGRCARG